MLTPFVHFLGTNTLQIQRKASNPHPVMQEKKGKGAQKGYVKLTRNQMWADLTAAEADRSRLDERTNKVLLKLW